MAAIIGHTALLKINQWLLLASNFLTISLFLLYLGNVVYYEANNTGVQVRFLRLWETNFANYVSYVEF